MAIDLVNRPLPANLGDATDLYHDVRELRLRCKKQMEDVESYEKALKEHLIQQIPKSDLGGVAGKFFRATITTKQVPTVKDWAAFFGEVQRTGRFDFLQKRISDKVVMETMEDMQKLLPGVELFNAVDVSVTKI